MSWGHSSVVPHHLQVEADVAEKIKEYCSKNNIYLQRLYADSGSAFGASDYLMLLKGKPYFIELKRSVGKQREGQKHFEKHVKLAGASYYIVKSVSELEHIIAESG